MNADKLVLDLNKNKLDISSSKKKKLKQILFINEKNF